jgi:hypothetical protein
MRKLQCAGGTLRGEANPTWLKQPTDKLWAAAGFTIAGIGMCRIAVSFYRLATGKGKMD